MTDRDELETLIHKTREAGAMVDVKRDSTGYPIEMRVTGLGIGHFPMSSLSFAERMREVLHKHGAK